MDATNLELTDEQKDAMMRMINTIKEFVKKVWDDFKKVMARCVDAFNLYVGSLEPKKRYKFLKSIGVANYVPYFKRKIHRCRNNC